MTSGWRTPSHPTVTTTVATPTAAPPAQTSARSSSGPRPPTHRPRSTPRPTACRSGLDDQGDDHRPAAVALADPAADDPPHHLLQLVDVAHAAGGGLGQ